MLQRIDLRVNMAAMSYSIKASSKIKSLDWQSSNIQQYSLFVLNRFPVKQLNALENLFANLIILLRCPKFHDGNMEYKFGFA